MIDLLQYVTHYSLHLLFPGLVAWIFFRDNWKKAWLIMILTMLVDLDHIFACKSFFEMHGGFWAGIVHLFECPDLYVADRCSIGFHPLHSYVAISIYAICLLIPQLRIIATGLLLHMATDFQDCLWMTV